MKGKHEMSKYEDLVAQFTKNLPFDALRQWCNLFSVYYEEPPLDDMYPNWESDLRTELAEEMMKLGGE